MSDAMLRTLTGYSPLLLEVGDRVARNGRLMTVTKRDRGHDRHGGEYNTAVLNGTVQCDLIGWHAADDAITIYRPLAKFRDVGTLVTRKPHDDSKRSKSRKSRKASKRQRFAVKSNQVEDVTSRVMATL